MNTRRQRELIYEDVKHPNTQKVWRKKKQANKKRLSDKRTHSGLL